MKMLWNIIATFSTFSCQLTEMSSDRKQQSVVFLPAFHMLRQSTRWDLLKVTAVACCDLHSRRHASPVLAVTGNPGMSPRWQPHYSDNCADWKYFRYVPGDVVMCSVPVMAREGHFCKLLTSATGCEIFHPRTTCRLKRVQRKLLPQRQTTAAPAHKRLWFITMWIALI